MNVGHLQKNTWEENVVSFANSEGFLGGWIFVLGCLGVCRCWVFRGSGGGQWVLSKFKTGRLGVELWVMILTVQKILLDTLFLDFHTS